MMISPAAVVFAQENPAHTTEGLNAPYTISVEETRAKQ
jgi:hypothetical protein